MQESESPILEGLEQAWTSADDGLHFMHATAVTHFRAHFPSNRTVRLDFWQQGRQVIESQWYHRSCLRHLSGVCLRHCFQAWFHAIRYTQLRRQHRKMAHKFRALRFEETIQQAATAASRYDMHTMFKVINKQSPKTPLKKMQLRSSEGLILSPVEEHAQIVRFVHDNWGGAPLAPPTEACIPGVPFSVSDLQAALRHIPATKAVAPTCAPGMIWSSFSDCMAQQLHDLLSFWWGSSPPFIPQTWKDGHLVLIPKPNKAPVRPQNLRPLCMMCPIGKAVLGLLTQIALHQAMPELRKWPIWAYMPKRSTQDTLAKVSQHCRAVQVLIHGQRSTPHSRMNPCARLSFCGGLQLFLDIDRAFDSIDRSKLFQEIHRLPIDPCIIQILHHWHIDTHYIIGYAGESTSVDVHRGLRQGCKAAPFLWNCMLVVFLHRLAQKVSMSWVLSSMSIYADDFHLSGIFHNWPEFQTLLQTFGLLFQLLDEYSLKVNHTKSVALLAVTGTNARKYRARCVRRDADGEKLQIRLPAGNSVMIPIQLTAKYLGCIMSYRNMEDSTSRHRLSLARTGFARLKHWLCSSSSQRHFRLQTRIRLWMQCICPILTYGIFAVGLTIPGALQLLTCIQTMFRQICGDPSLDHWTHT